MRHAPHCYTPTIIRGVTMDIISPMSESEPARVPGVRPSGLMFERRREDLVRGAGFDPRTFTGGRVLRVLSGGLHRASEIYLLVLDDSPAQSVVDLLTKPTRVLLEEQRFASPGVAGPAIVYARQSAGEPSNLVERLKSASVDVDQPTAHTLAPFGEDAFLRTDVNLWGFWSQVQEGGTVVDVIGLLMIRIKTEEAAQEVAEGFLDRLAKLTSGTPGPVETFFTAWAGPVNNAVIYRGKPRRVEPHEVSSVS
jgi:hypothetical protein